MDCERFESALLDELHGELDELTSAAAKRHIAGCARCSSRIGSLRATRRVAAIPIIEPSSDLEERILAAAESGQRASPSRPRMAQIISLAGSWAMRPQTAMATVFLVMIGTSVLLLRGKSARAPVSAEVTVTEQGTPAPVASAPSMGMVPDRMKTSAPESEGQPEARQQAPPAAPRDLLAQAAPAGPPAPAHANAEAPSVAESADQKPDEMFDAALRSYRAGRFDEAAREFDALASADPNSPDLWAARAIRDGRGCRAAVTRFDKTAQRYKQTPPGWDALLEGALCYRALGEFGIARTRLGALLGVDSHKDRARVELDRIDDLQQAKASGDAPPTAKATIKARSGGPAAAAQAPADSTR